jgi:hypothetical protein
MNPKKTIVLAVLAIAIIAIYVYDKEQVTEQKKKEEETKDFFLTESKDIMKIAIDRNGKKISAERDGENWKITEPLSWQGDKYAWNSIADNLASAKIDRTFPDEGETLTDADREKWGVKAPTLNIAATIRAESKEITLGFGNHPPGGSNQVFGQSSERPDNIFIIPQSVVVSASKELRDLRNRKIIDVRFDDKQITRVEVNNKSLAMVAEKGAGDTWQLTQPISARVDNAQLRKLVDKLGNDASNIIDSPSEELLKEVSLASDQLASATRYKVFTGESSQTFYIGNFSVSEKAYVGKREGTDSLFVLAKEFFTDQPKAIDELRPKKALSLETWNTDILTATSEGKLLYSVSKMDGKWRMVSPEDATAERDLVEAIIRAFNDNKIISFAEGAGSDPDLGLDHPSLVLKATGKDATETILFGKENEGKVYAAWSGAPDRFLVDKKLLEAVRKDPLSLLTPAERDRINAKNPPPAPAPAPETAPAPIAPATATEPVAPPPAPPVESAPAPIGPESPAPPALPQVVEPAAPEVPAPAPAVLPAATTPPQPPVVPVVPNTGPVQ